jgi:uncharacterized membrane protein (UPF0127 family)
MIIRNDTKNASLVDKGKVADTFFARLKGLLGSATLTKGEGLLITHEKSIHTFFMRYPIDVVYIDKNWQVIKVDCNMVPFRLGGYVTKAAYILELPGGTIQETQTTIGDQLSFSN